MPSVKIMYCPVAEVWRVSVPVLAAVPLLALAKQNCLPAAAVGRSYVTAVAAVAFSLKCASDASVVLTVTGVEVSTTTFSVGI